jgi:hypothetical protein
VQKDLKLKELAQVRVLTVPRKRKRTSCRTNFRHSSCLRLKLQKRNGQQVLEYQIYQHVQEGKQDHQFQDPILQEHHTTHDEDHWLQEPRSISHREKRGLWEYEG